VDLILKIVLPNLLAKLSGAENTALSPANGFREFAPGFARLLKTDAAARSGRAVRVGYRGTEFPVSPGSLVSGI
jgi:hypothetical protein